MSVAVAATGTEDSGYVVVVKSTSPPVRTEATEPVTLPTLTGVAAFKLVFIAAVKSPDVGAFVRLVVVATVVTAACVSAAMC